MRVLMITQAVDLDYSVLGFTVRWVNALAQHVEHLHVVALRAGRADLVSNVTMHTYESGREAPDRWQRLRFYNQELSHLVLHGQVDVAFIHMIPQWVLMTAPYARLRGIPVVLWYTHSAVTPKLRVAHLLAQRILTASRESYRLPHGDKVHVLGHGIDTEYFHPSPRSPDEAFNVLSVGRISPVKQHDVLVEAARILVYQQGLQGLQVCIVGGPALSSDEGYAERLQQTVMDYGLQQHVSIVGPIPYDQMATTYHSSDLFANLSRTDSLDKAALEAMACGLPVVSSNPALAPLLKGVSADLFFPHGDPAALARAIACVAELPASERQQMGLSLRNRVEQEHGVERLMNRIAQEFQEITHSE